MVGDIAKDGAFDDVVIDKGLYTLFSIPDRY